MSFCRIPTPDLSRISDERKKFLSDEMFKIYFDNNLERYSDEKYYSWEKIKFLEIPKELQSSEELWYVIR